MYIYIYIRVSLALALYEPLPFPQAAPPKGAARLKDWPSIDQLGACHLRLPTGHCDNYVNYVSIISIIVLLWLVLFMVTKC